MLSFPWFAMLHTGATEVRSTLPVYEVWIIGGDGHIETGAPFTDMN